MTHRTNSVKQSPLNFQGLTPLVLLLFTFLIINLSCTRKNQSNGIHRTSVRWEIKTLDPAQAVDYGSARQVATTYEPLFDYDYHERPYKLVPKLAKSWSQTKNRDGVTGYEITIKPGIYFHRDPCFGSQGRRELLASDIVYSLKRLANPRLTSPAYWIVKPVLGIDEWRKEISSQKGQFEDPIKGLAVLGRYQLRILLKEPTPWFLHSLAAPASAIVPKEAVDFYGDRFPFQPVGTGPYLLDRKNSKPRERLFWRPNPEYRQPIKNKGIDVRVLQEQSTRRLELLKGNLDILDIAPELAHSIIHNPEEKKKYESKKIRLVKSWPLETRGIIFNTSLAKLRDPRVRQAISIAVDSKKYVQELKNGIPKLARGPIPPGIPGDFFDENPHQVFDLGLARKLMEAAGYSKSQPLTLVLTSSLQSEIARTDADYFRRQLEKIYVKLENEYLAWSQLLEGLYKGRFEMTRLSWIADYPDPENFLSLFYSKSDTNYAKFSHPEYDRLYLRSHRVGEKERTRIYQQMVKILVDQCPWVWLSHPAKTTLIHSRLKNYLPHTASFSTYQYYEIRND